MHQPQHRVASAKVVMNFIDDALLRAGQLERQVTEKALLERARPA